MKKMVKYHEDLGLSAEQVASIEDLKLATKKGVVMKDAEIKLVKLDAKDILYSDDYGAESLESINSLIEQKYSLKEERAKMLVKAYADLKGIVSAEQYKAFKDMMKSKKSCCKKSCSGGSCSK